MAQETPSNRDLIDGLNRALQAEQIGTSPEPMLLNGALEPQWGIVVENSEGEVVDVFGQVPYSVRSGQVQVPGYDPPPGANLRVVPQHQLRETSIVLASAEDLDPDFAPITKLPGAVETATDYLATELCSAKGRPTQITLSLVVSASGNILFAQAGVEAGSEVMWDFPTDVCPRYGFPQP